MSIDIEGWIEVKNEQNIYWEGIENISTYLIFAGEESNYLFGISKISCKESLAGYRGLPGEISKEVAASLDRWRQFEKEESNFSFAELFGFSYLGYDEVLEHNLIEVVGNDCGWRRVFDKMREIEANGHKAGNIRVVVWAIW